MSESAPNSAQASAIWSRIASWWDAQIGEGNEFQKLLIMPATDRLLDVKPGQVILDVACGNGNYSRQLAARGAKVIACDACAEFLECARQRTAVDHPSHSDSIKNSPPAASSMPGIPAPIEFLQIDATDPLQLASLGKHRFDAAVCSMAMMDMPAISPLLHALRDLLIPSGRFVFSLPHPCFNSNRSRMSAELINESGRTEQIFSVSIREYLAESVDQSSGILNQPEPHYLFHRPLTKIFAECFEAGFIVDGFEEPAYPPGQGSAKNPFSWAKRPQIPPAVVVRVRPK